MQPRQLSEGLLCGSGECRSLCMLNGHAEFFLHQSGLFRIHQAEFHYGQLFTTSEQITQPAFSQRDAAKRSPAPGSYCKRCWINSVIEHINLLPVQMPISPPAPQRLLTSIKCREKKNPQSSWQIISSILVLYFITVSFL